MRRQEPKPITQEILEVSSGSIVAIDHFMLGSEAFSSAVSDRKASDAESLFKGFGGCLLKLPKGKYKSYRDAKQQLVILFMENGNIDDTTVYDLAEELVENKEHYKQDDQICVDTRCFVLADMDIIRRRSTLEDYKNLRKEKKEKSSRDFLRERGAIVRYGFGKYGETMGVYKVDDSTVAFWPVNEN